MPALGRQALQAFNPASPISQMGFPRPGRDHHVRVAPLDQPRGYPPGIAPPREQAVATAWFGPWNSERIETCP